MKAAATVGVLTAGGGGTYWYWNSRPSDDANRSQAHSATEQLKNLFASSDDSTPSSGQLPTGSSQTASPKSSENRFAVNNPPTALLGDRYAKYSQAVAAPVASPIDLAAKSAGVDVARGQGPDVNPLRGEIQQTAVYEEADELDARAVFGEVAATQKPTATTSSSPTASPAVANDAAGFASALAQAQPLQPTPAMNQPAAGAFGQNPFASKSPAGSPIVTPPPAVDNRYASAAAAPTLPPVIDMAKVASTSTAREPVSAFGTNLGAIPVTSPAKSLSLEPQSSGITSTPGLASQPGSGRPGERILEGTQSPSITIQKLAPPEIQVGKRCTFAIRVQNTGQRTAQGVQIHDEIPLGTELVGTAPRAAVSGTQVSWDLGTLSVGEERTVEMELIPTEEGELGSVATITLAAQASAKGIATLEAPVTGGVHLAAQGKITVLAGGDTDLFDLHKPALQAMGGQLFHMGPLGSAAIIKVITNMLAFIHLVADGEALMLAKRGGLDLAQSWAAIKASSGTSFVHETEGQLILNGSYDIAFTMDLALKDLGFAMNFGREFGVPLDLATLTNETFNKGREAYGGSAQSTQIVKLLEDALATDLRAPGFPARLE